MRLLPGAPYLENEPLLVSLIRNTIQISLNVLKLLFVCLSISSLCLLLFARIVDQYHGQAIAREGGAGREWGLGVGWGQGGD
jgi:hypothetical protein